MSKKSIHNCPEMKKRLNYKCDIHKNKYECPDNLVTYSKKLDEYGIIIHDGGASYILINYCPWCGTKLPDSEREESELNNINQNYHKYQKA